MLRNTIFCTVLVAGLASVAHATVTEPNGLVVPIDSTAATKEVQIFTVLQQRDSALDWQKDSDTQPEVFSPLCSFTAELILKQTGSNLGIGWYNVDKTTNTPPPYNQIYQIIPPSSPVGTKITGKSIKDDVNYKGGLIGFALMEGTSTNSHYSERRLNIQCTDTSKCPTPGSWITSITYISKSLPNTFFLGFEDGGLTSSSWSNDGDFNDYVFQFTGLTCQGGGKPCTVPGVQGICSSGVTQCVIGGTTTCKQVLQPEAVEKCDGLDNDCNGQVDDGATCSGGLICDRGRCVGSCSSEFPCASGLTCDSGRCVDTACTGVSCSGGTVCRLGSCVDPCTGVKCPGSQICRVGRCVDACDGVTCPSGQVCQGGACVPGCDCYPCGDPAQGCSKSSNICVETACVNVTCGAGEVCQGGSCVAACTGAVCPNDQSCTMGRCVDNDIPPDPNAGVDAGAGADMDNGSGSIASGCACRLSPTGDAPGAMALLAGAAILALALRRRRLLA